MRTLLSKILQMNMHRQIGSLLPSLTRLTLSRSRWEPRPQSPHCKRYLPVANVLPDPGILHDEVATLMQPSIAVGKLLKLKHHCFRSLVGPAEVNLCLGLLLVIVNDGLALFALVDALVSFAKSSCDFWRPQHDKPQPPKSDMLARPETN